MPVEEFFCSSPPVDLKEISNIPEEPRLETYNYFIDNKKIEEYNEDDFHSSIAADDELLEEIANEYNYLSEDNFIDTLMILEQNPEIKDFISNIPIEEISLQPKEQPLPMGIQNNTQGNILEQKQTAIIEYPPLINRKKPQDVEAETYVLGSIMMDKDIMESIINILSPSDFYSKAHQYIYQAMVELYEKSEEIDIVTVSSQLAKTNTLNKVGGRAYVVSLGNKLSDCKELNLTEHATSHANIVKEKSKRRNLIQSATKIASYAYEEAEPLENIFASAEKEIFKVSSSGAVSKFASMKELMVASVERINQFVTNKGAPIGLQSHYIDFDRMTYGLQNSDFIILAARPSMGKTAFALNIATNIALEENKHVGIFSLEMSKEQLSFRMLCSEARISTQKIAQVGATDADWDRLLNSGEKLSKAPIHIDDTGSISVMELASKARRLKAEEGLDLIIIDYLQLMQGKQIRKSDNRQQEISDISRSLKSLARELNIPIIALSQLSRGVENRQVKKPMLSDLRESGSLEQDADIVIFLYRDDYYDEESENKNITDIIVAKNRNGPVGTVQLYFQKEFTRFENLKKQ